MDRASDADRRKHLERVRKSAAGDLTGRRRRRCRAYVRPVNSVSEIGSDLIRFPVMAKIALQTAGAIGGVAGSPMPPQRLPPDSARWVSHLGGVGHLQHGIGVEIGLLDGAVLDRDGVAERGGEAVDHAALHLHLDEARVDDMAAIHRDRDPLDLDLALGADGDLGDFGHDGAEGFMDGDAAALALGHRLAPAGLVRRDVQHL